MTEEVSTHANVWKLYDFREGGKVIYFHARNPAFLDHLLGIACGNPYFGYSPANSLEENCDYSAVAHW